MAVCLFCFVLGLAGDQACSVVDSVPELGRRTGKPDVNSFDVQQTNKQTNKRRGARASELVK